MGEYVYLIQNGELYNLGCTSNLVKTQEMLSPGNTFAYLKTKNAESICKNLQKRYFNERLPQSDYFRLKQSQLLECKFILRREGGEEYFEPIFKGKTLIFTFLIAWVSISLFLIKFGIDPILRNVLINQKF